MTDRATKEYRKHKFKNPFLKKMLMPELLDILHDVCKEFNADFFPLYEIEYIRYVLDNTMEEHSKVKKYILSKYVK